ncbi:hypothetical protein [Roseivirga sp.]|uniref:hypothetical protein n=1 Tax=Roseivirga sp. TaxID=1964215 RepID=UPI003B8DD70B
MLKKPLKSLMLISFYGLLVLGLLELTLRLLGYEPIRPVSRVIPTTNREFDLGLGWKLLPGHYEIGPFNDIGDSMSITIKKDTGRAARMNNLSIGDKKITFIGGSFMMGYALDNDETAVWKLQERFPQFDFRNLAVSAYGGLQSLIVLEKELEKGNKPKCVIYGAFQHHELRNVAQGDWLMKLRRRIPYATLKNDSIFERKGLIKMKHLRYTNKLASAVLAERVLNRILSYNRVKDARKLSHLIIKEMHRLTSEHGIAFYVAPLWYDEQAMEDLTHFLTESNISFIDCNVPLTRDNIIKDDGHPDPSVNDIWVERIAKRLITDGITGQPQ